MTEIHRGIHGGPCGPCSRSMVVQEVCTLNLLQIQEHIDKIIEVCCCLKCVPCVPLWLSVYSCLSYEDFCSVMYMEHLVHRTFTSLLGIKKNLPSVNIRGCGQNKTLDLKKVQVK